LSFLSKENQKPGFLQLYEEYVAGPISFAFIDKSSFGGGFQSKVMFFRWIMD